MATDTPNPTVEPPARLGPALLVFAATYVLVSAAVTAVLMAFDIDSSMGIAVGLLIAATAAAASRFVGQHQRAMTRREQLRFTLLAWTATLLISIVQVAVMLPFVIGADEWGALASEASAWVSANAGVLVVVVVGVSLLYFALIYFMVGNFSRWFAKRIPAAGKI